jgi:GPH family glycoside/pentoside/hexuronide:cation symporter
MSDDFHERTSIMAVAQWIGQWAWVIAPWFWVVMYDPSWFENADAATRHLSIWVGVICMLLAMVPALFIPSRSSVNDTHLVPLTWANIGGGMREILAGFKEAFSSAPFRKLCFSTFLIFNAFNTVAAFSFFIVVYHLFGGKTADAGIWPTLFGSIGALITTFAVIPTVAWMSRRMGKKNAFMLSQGISIIGYVLLWFLMVPGKPWMFMFALPFFSFGIGGLFTLMMSMTADVCDLDELATGKRREGIFGAIYWWMVKFGFAIAGLLSGAIMSLVAFTPGAATQPDGAVDGLRLFYSGVPIFGTLLAMWIMRNYDLDEARAAEVHAELERRKQRGSGPSQGSAVRPWLADHGLLLPGAEPSPLAALPPEAVRALYAEQFRSGLYGLCFSAYVEGQRAGDALLAADVSRRVDLVAPHTRWVRSFACTEGHEAIARLARAKGLKTMVGAWISQDRERNEREIAALIALARDGVVDIAVVGNEVLLRGELGEAELLDYVRRVRAALPEGVRVGCVDAYFQFLERPALVAACDVLLPNCYPFWEGASIDLAAQYLRRMHGLVKAAAGDDKLVIVAETGWPGRGQPVGGAVPSPENAMRYFVDVQQWARREGVRLFYFASFDEPWKRRQEGEVGTQWGLWDKDERLKYLGG